MLGMAARLVDQQATNVVAVLERPAALLEDGSTRQVRGAFEDDPERLPGGVVVDRCDPQAAIPWDRA